MYIRIEVDGQEREFALYVPAGWLQYVSELGTGLPLVMVLHGGNMDIEGMRGAWDFAALATAPGAAAEDRFFVLYPQGGGFNDIDDTISLTDLPAASGWSTGFGEVSGHDDVLFLRSALEEARRRLRVAMDATGLFYDPFHRDRLFLFGYSAGGMMAYRLVANWPFEVAALWVYATTHGGRQHFGVAPTVTNLPTTGDAVSLCHHHGLIDLVVSPLGMPLAPSPLAIDILTLLGFDKRTAQSLAPASLNPNDAVLAYIAEFPVAPGWVPVPLQPGLGVEPRTEQRWDDRSGHVARLILDPGMDHTNFANAAPGVRYFYPSDVWEWFKEHPRP